MWKILSLVVFLNVQLFAVGEAGAIFLLIIPGAGPAATGEAQVAKVDDAYASYFNPAGLAFLPNQELSMMHVNWLPNLASDLYYEFLAYRQHVPNLGSFGGHIIFLDLGEQHRTDEYGNDLGTFRSNMWALTGSFSTLVSENSSIGVNAKIFQQNLIDRGTAAEAGKGKSTDFAFDLGYLLKTRKLNFGVAISNIGPKISFIDANQADPAPTNMRMGIKWEVFNDNFNRIDILFDINKMLVSSYPAMDWDGDGIVGGYSENGSQGMGDYNKDGQIEIAHTDPWYYAWATSWFDDWYLGGDIDYPGLHNEDRDGVIGGWKWEDANGDGVISAENQGSNSDPDWVYEEMVVDSNGEYNEFGVKEKGTGDERKFSAELEEIVYNFGLEYWYTDYFVLRGGFIYDEAGSIKVPTFGAGIRFAQYGFDFGYTAGEEGHPRANTMFFSINMEF
ncbi:MAG: PorV/PorQ family protein [Candidatus Marinimicrobia bacterium]|nr:PorV/PorQ family protein [Candidatus Neomarinimicrobiota bacterium]MBL7022643.1 PorV/PorQ family protein [Candidatus Neomarinimicrobiota bacterium]